MRNNHHKNRNGNALLLAIIVTMLLFIIGMAFLSSTITEKTSISHHEHQATLNNAVDSVINDINNVLVQDLFGSGSASMLNGSFTNEYWDYPNHRLYDTDNIPGNEDDSVVDPVNGIFGDTGLGKTDDYSYFLRNTDTWLSNLEPSIVDYSETPLDLTNDDVGFEHITDLYGTLADLFQNSYTRDSDGLITSGILYTDSDDDRISFRKMRATIIDPDAPIENLLYPLVLEGAKADADGDGVADARWVIIPNSRQVNGQWLWAAVRIIDNCGMINVNTAYKNDDSLTPNTTIGRYLTDVSLLGINPSLSATDAQIAIDAIHWFRAYNHAAGFYQNPYDITILIPPYNLPYYKVIHFLDYMGPLAITPFDLSDELDLRNRFYLNAEPVTSRIEAVEDENKNIFWKSFLVNNRRFLPCTGNTGSDVSDWYENIHWIAQYYDKRHFLTTYSWSRTVGSNRGGSGNVAGFDFPPVRGTQADINNDNADRIAGALISALNNFGSSSEKIMSATLACNIVDFRDGLNAPSSLYIDTDNNGSSDTYIIGHEPQPYIVGLNATIETDGTGNVDINSSTFEIELYNPYSRSIELKDYAITLYDKSLGTQVDNVIPLSSVATTLLKGQTGTISNSDDPDIVFAAFSGNSSPYTVTEYTIALTRQVSINSSTENFLLDKFECPDYVQSDWLEPDGTSRSTTMRTTVDWNVIWDPAPTLNYNLDIPNSDFRCVGEVSKVLAIGPPHLSSSADINSIETVGEQLQTGGLLTTGRLDLSSATDNTPRQLLQNLTVITRMDGNDDNGDSNIDDQNELRIPGRININTAPQRVIESLPWVDEKLAKAIVLYRNMQQEEVETSPSLVLDYTLTGGNGPGIPGFKTTGELVRVTNPTSAGVADQETYDIQFYQKNSSNDDSSINVGPCFDTITDNATDDVEERDIIFHRISNLVTVRSDVFTAYILVRLGTNGPQKRMLAIFDRSNVFSPNQRPNLVALHPVPDPR